MFQVRIFPKGSVEIAFTNTRNQTNHTVVWMLQNTGTTIYHNGSKTADEESIIKYNELNDIHISFTTTQITVKNLDHKKITITGDYHFLRFIGFDSTLDSSWVVQESNMFSCEKKTNEFFSSNPIRDN